MNEPRSYGGVTFDAGLTSATREDGSTVPLTRAERALLACFMDNPARLLRRDRLLDAMSSEGSASVDRNVDFVIHRLRTKLRDPARQPRLIATHYGEGYSWIATPAVSGSRAVFMSIGPVHGRGDPRTARLAAPTLERLRERLAEILGPERGVELRPAGQAGDGTNPRYGIEASLHAEGRKLHAAFILRRARVVIGSFRAIWQDDASDACTIMARDMIDAVWRHEATPPPPGVAPPDEPPLEIRLHEAARTLVSSPESWRVNEAQLDAARQARPDDPLLGLMWALTLYGRLVQSVGPGAVPSPRAWDAIEAEIENLAFASLGIAESNPLLMLGAAKLLFFVNRGHFDLAERLAEEAFAESTAFAAAFATLGQMRMCRGRFDAALDFFDKGIELSAPGSSFHLYLLTLRCTALLASGERAALDASAEAIFGHAPDMRYRLGLLMVSPEETPLPPPLEAAARALPAGYAKDVLFLLYQQSARHFLRREHRHNVMAGPAAHLSRLHGPPTLPPPVRQLLRKAGKKAAAAR